MTVHKNEDGFTLVMAIFMLVVFALVSAVLINMSGVASQTSTMSMRSVRAYSAARSGIEWGIFRVITDSDCTNIATPPGVDIVLPASANGIQGLAVNIGCTQIAMANPELPSPGYDPGLATFRITANAQAVATSPGSPDFAERRIEAVIRTR